MGFQNANIEFQGGQVQFRGGQATTKIFALRAKFFLAPPLNFAREGQKASLRSAAPPPISNPGDAPDPNFCKFFF